LRKRIVAGNWKMHKNLHGAIDLCEELVAALNPEDTETTHVVIAPPAPFLMAVSDVLDEYDFVTVAAQNCHQATHGAYTGEFSAEMVASVGADAVILGHSERRQFFGETDTLIAEKIKAAHAQELVAIYCCGELLADRKSGNYKQVVAAQIEAALFGLAVEALENVVIAYEPVWAIGTGETASPEQAEEVHAFIRSLIAKQFGLAAAQNMSILYGGSCKPNNAEELFACENIDGGLIGGASLEAKDFAAIVRAMRVKDKA
jgi:triosephosphate isomerase (TIM)